MVKPYSFSHYTNLPNESAREARLIGKSSARVWEFDGVRGYSTTIARKHTHMPNPKRPQPQPRQKKCLRPVDTDRQTDRHRDRHRRNIPPLTTLYMMMVTVRPADSKESADDCLCASINRLPKQFHPENDPLHPGKPGHNNKIVRRD